MNASSLPVLSLLNDRMRHTSFTLKPAHARSSADLLGRVLTCFSKNLRIALFNCGRLRAPI